MSTYEIIREKETLTRYFQIQSYDHIVATDLFMTNAAFFWEIYENNRQEWFLIATDKMYHKTGTPYQLNAAGIFQYPFNGDQEGEIMYQEMVISDQIPSFVMLHHRQGRLHIFDRYEGMMYFCYNERIRK